MNFKHNFSIGLKYSVEQSFLIPKPLILTLIFLCFGAIKLKSQDLLRLKKGNFVYNFLEIDGEGEEVELDSYRGKIVLINFTHTHIADHVGRLIIKWTKYKKSIQIN